MRYCCPTMIDEAVAILAADDDARCLAGGATLVAMLNADLFTPSTVVSLRGIADLDGIHESGTGFTIGAMTRHVTVANDPRLHGGLAVVRLAAQEIGHPAIRAVGTIGGSVAHADPSADYPSALVAANAQIEIKGNNDTRRVSARDFFQDFFTTALEPGEMVTAIHLAQDKDETVSTYLK
ncbi:MAG: FAD binding domain-containing protein, partial [Gammaproteobacteria bacterium]